MNGFWPADFPPRKLFRDECIVIEKAFWELFSATRFIKELEEFLVNIFYDDN